MFKEKFRSMVSMVLILLILIGTVGCTQKPVVDAPVVDGEKKEETVDKDEKKEDSYIVIKDHLNRELKLEKEPERIVSGYYITTSLLIALGLKDKVVGIEAKANSRPIYKLAAPEFLDLPNVGTAKEFNLEGTISLNPDLVILPIRLKDAIESLENLGITVLAVNPEDMDLLKETIDMIGKATGTESRAENLKYYYDKKLFGLNELVTEDKVKIYLGGNTDFLSTATDKMYQNYLIETAGGINVAGDIDEPYWAAISNEQLLSYNPDMIVIASGAAYTKEDIIKDKNYTGLNAVKNNMIFTIPDNYEMWDSPVPSSILGIMYLSSILHEDKYNFEEFKQDVADFYKEFYNIEINKDEIAR